MKFAVLLLLFLQLDSFAQTAESNLRRAAEFGKTAPSLLLRNDIRVFWSADGHPTAWRVNTNPGEHAYFAVDPASGKKSPAFDHEALAKALAKETGKAIDAGRLPIERLEMTADPRVVRIRADGKSWRFDAAGDRLTTDDLPPAPANLISPEEARRGGRGNGGPTTLTIENGTAGEIEMFWLAGRGERTSYGKVAPGGSATQNTYSGHLWLMTDAKGEPLAAVAASDTPSSARVTGRVPAPPRRRERNLSPDGKWEASIRDHNVVVIPADGGEAIPLGTGGSKADAFEGPLVWSPDSRKLVAFRTKKVEQRQIHIVESSPDDQVEPKLKTLDYTKPGDPIRQPKPYLFDVSRKSQLPVDDALFGNPFDINEISWTKDSSEFLFAYNERGHQLMRVVGVRADSGSVRTVYEERNKTFIDYSQKFYLKHLAATGELLWASEKDGYNHLYLIDAASGRIKNPVTRGNWNVREVVEVDEEKRHVLLKVVGVTGQDPYHLHFVRVDFDGGNFTRLTTSDGNHRIDFSPDRKFHTATWSRVDQPPVVELRRSDDGSLVCEIERADDSALLKTGWSRPERFVAKGRDGTTDIHGVIVRPLNFDPARKYSVVEDIYAGPHDHFVPKNYAAWSGMNAMAEQGFVVVKIDGMGTNWRSKAFHDVAWKNLADSGFPDRIPWIKAAAADRPWMDLARVGIYGGSAGGQSTLAALLHHGDFYKVGVADCGCHDNRMDKIWWNEAWMGWPVDESYARNSNVTNAAKLTGKLLLVVGELDSNVDPASSAQVVAALQKADKDFDFLPIMGAGHGAAETPYGKRRRADFLVRHLIGAGAAAP